MPVCNCVYCTVAIASHGAWPWSSQGKDTKQTVENQQQFDHSCNRKISMHQHLLLLFSRGVVSLQGLGDVGTNCFMWHNRGCISGVCWQGHTVVQALPRPPSATAHSRLMCLWWQGRDRAVMTLHHLAKREGWQVSVTDSGLAVLLISRPLPSCCDFHRVLLVVNIISVTFTNKGSMLFFFFASFLLLLNTFIDLCLWLCCKQMSSPCPIEPIHCGLLC